MAIVGPALSSNIETALFPWNGVQLTPFSQAIGNGIAIGTIGVLQFVTKDVGVKPGVGVGKGTGIVGMDSSKMSQVIFDTGQDAWKAFQNNGPGVEWKIFCDKVSKAIVKYMEANADLVSTHGPIFVGNGQVASYSGLTPGGVAGSIVAEAPAPWAKARFPELALAVATGYVTEITGHSPGSSVVIAGSPTGEVSGGNGSGAGQVL
jgi:hypothetical protein